MLFGRVRNQIFSALASNVVMLGFGCAIGWLSPALPLLRSSDTPLQSGPLTTDQLALTGSALSIGALVGNLLFSVIAVHFGAKKSSLLLAIPQMASWMLLFYGTVAEHLYASRFMSGMAGGGVQTAVMLYLSQVADDDIRGSLGVLSQLMRCFGTLFAFVLGTYLDYVEMAVVFASVTIIFVISFIGMPSTPVYLLQIGAPDRAEASLRFYKGFKRDEDSKEVRDAFNRLYLISNESWKRPLMKTIFYDSYARKGIITAIVFAILGLMCANFIITTYASKLFEDSGSHLSPNASAIILAVVQLAGTLLAIKFVESLGRKSLLILSLAGSTVGTLTLAIYSLSKSFAYDVSAFAWVPIASMTFVIFISSVGIVPLGPMCTVEALPKYVRSIGLTIGMFTMNVTAFLLAWAFPILLDAIQLHGCMLIFSVSCAFGIIYVVFCVDETKGKQLDALTEEKFVSVVGKL